MCYRLYNHQELHCYQLQQYFAFGGIFKFLILTTTKKPTPLNPNQPQKLQNYRKLKGPEIHSHLNDFYYKSRKIAIYIWLRFFDFKIGN
jgi:hypothetical protein